MTQPPPDFQLPPPAGTPAPHELQYENALFVDRDTEHLRILSICWYVMSGLAVLMGCFPIFHVSFGLFMIFSPKSFGPGTPPPPFMGWMFFLMGSAFMLAGWSVAILGFFTARSLPRRRRITICYVGAALACLWVPLGTLLGVFTFIVLSRPNVKASFH